MGKKKKMLEPKFLKVKPRDTVLFGEEEIAKVLSFVGGSREPLHFSKSQTLIQVKSNLFMVRKWNKFCLSVKSG